MTGQPERNIKNKQPSNPGLRGKAFVDALASLGDTLEDGPSWGQLGANMSQLEPTWGHLGTNLGPT